MSGWLGLPVAASAHAPEIDGVLVMVHWLMAVLGAGWGAYFLFTLARSRRRAEPAAAGQTPAAPSGPRWKYAVVIIEVLVVAGLLIPAYSTNATAGPPAAGALEVRIVAEQFAWNVQYPGADGVFGRTDIRLMSSDNPLGLDLTDPAARDDVMTINDFAMPVDRPVLVHLTSKDVIHSLGLPQMRVKQDAVPGIVYDLWFTPTRLGAWEIACSQLCGLGHYRMRGFYSVRTPEAFTAWLNEAARP